LIQRYSPRTVQRNIAPVTNDGSSVSSTLIKLQSFEGGIEQDALYLSESVLVLETEKASEPLMMMDSTAATSISFTHCILQALVDGDLTMLTGIGLQFE
jgi:hypothetical protein